MSAPASIPSVGAVLACLVVTSKSYCKFPIVSDFCLIVDSRFHPSRALTRSLEAFTPSTWTYFCYHDHQVLEYCIIGGFLVSLAPSSMVQLPLSSILLVTEYFYIQFINYKNLNFWVICIKIRCKRGFVSPASMQKITILNIYRFIFDLCPTALSQMKQCHKHSMSLCKNRSILELSFDLARNCASVRGNIFWDPKMLTTNPLCLDKYVC